MLVAKNLFLVHSSICGNNRLAWKALHRTKVSPRIYYNTWSTLTQEIQFSYGQVDNTPRTSIGSGCPLQCRTLCGKSDQVCMQKMEPLQDLVHDDYGAHQYNTKHAHIHKAGKCESGWSRHITCCTWAEFLFFRGRGIWPWQTCHLHHERFDYKQTLLAGWPQLDAICTAHFYPHPSFPPIF